MSLIKSFLSLDEVVRTWR